MGLDNKIPRSFLFFKRCNSYFSLALEHRYFFCLQLQFHI